MTLIEARAPMAEEAAPRRGTPRRRLVPRMHPAWIIVLVACAVLVRVGMDTGLNTDVFWQLAAGQWMLGHHAVITHDPFSYSVPGHPWFAEEWGYEVILAWMVAHLGSVSYWILASGPCCAALIFGVVRWRRQGAQPLWSAGLAIVAAMGLGMGVAPRPQVLSYALFALELLILTMARKDERWLLAIPPLMLFWANVHGSFLAGLGILALDVALSTAVASSFFSLAKGRRLVVTQPLAFKKGAAVLAASVAAACVNPHGPALFSYAYKTSTSGQLAAYIGEWKSPDFHALIIMAAIAIPTVLAILILAGGRRRVELFDLVVWVVLLLATLRSTRFMPYLGLALGGVLATYQPIRRETIRANVVSPVLAALACLVVLAGSHPAAGAPQTKGSLANPVQAAAWLSHQQGRVFSTYTWNDYLIQARIPVFVDGRTDMYFGTPILTDYVEIQNLTVNPDPILNRYRVEWVLWPKDQPLSLYLARDGNWTLAKKFGSQLIFKRATN